MTPGQGAGRGSRKKKESCIKSRAVLSVISVLGECIPADALFRWFCCAPTLPGISISIGVYTEYNPPWVSFEKAEHRAAIVRWIPARTNEIPRTLALRGESRSRTLKKFLLDTKASDKWKGRDSIEFLMPLPRGDLYTGKFTSAFHVSFFRQWGDDSWSGSGVFLKWREKSCESRLDRHGGQEHGLAVSVIPRSSDHEEGA